MREHPCIVAKRMERVNKRENEDFDKMVFIWENAIHTIMVAFSSQRG